MCLLAAVESVAELRSMFRRVVALPRGCWAAIQPLYLYGGHNVRITASVLPRWHPADDLHHAVKSHSSTDLLTRSVDQCDFMRPVSLRGSRVSYGGYAG